ncbi:MAG: CDP-alcohol phosphatidyltransferase family protein [Planctomycetes bacterium]|nr:CDP-alcohol phosphatidyltransferase family protein [Planctomycetota bacterium]
MWTLANILTLSRFVTAPVFLVLILSLPEEGNATLAWAATALILVTLITDMLDGAVARACRAVTDFGKIMDPVADSTFFLTAILAFTISDRFQAPIWAAVVVLYREIGMHVLRRYAALRGIVLAAKFSGKAKMVIQSLAMVLLMVMIAATDSGWLNADLPAWIFWVFTVIAAVNILSLPEYLLAIPSLYQQSSNQDTDSTE